MLEVRDLACAYGPVQALDKLSFALEAGSMVGLIGANGAGKTTTIMALAGLLKPKGGKVLLKGQDITRLAAHRRVDHGVALVPEGRRVFADLRVEENLIVGGSRLTRSALERNRQRVYDIFPRLAERRRQLAGSLSGGEQQMLAIGRAMMADPALLLVDELSLGLMPRAVDDCYAVLRRLQGEGLAILLVEQSTERVLACADQIIVLESGREAWSGSAADATHQSRILEAYLGQG